MIANRERRKRDATSTDFHDPTHRRMQTGGHRATRGSNGTAAAGRDTGYFTPRMSDRIEPGAHARLALRSPDVPRENIAGLRRKMRGLPRPADDAHRIHGVAELGARDLRLCADLQFDAGERGPRQPIEQ